MPVLTQEMNQAPAENLQSNLRREIAELNQEHRAAKESFGNSFQIEQIEDESGWARSVVHIEGFDLPITFRGKSELPVLPADDERRVVSLTPKYKLDETEILTTDALREWNAARGNPLQPESNNNPAVLIEHALESSIQDGVKETIVSVDATPLGICQFLRAVKDILPEDYFSDDVKELLEYVDEDGIVENEAAQQLMIDMLASGSVSTIGQDGPAPDALAAVLLSRVGKPEDRKVAQELLSVRRKLHSKSVQYSYMLDRGIESADDIEAAMSVDTTEMIARSEGLVWVHSNKSKIERGSKVMPLKDFHSQSTRASVHGALNHTVNNATAKHGESVSGAEAQTTIISPLGSMIKLNDKPTSLYGVDTYWDRDGGVEIPVDAYLIHAGTDVAEFDSSGREISIPKILDLEQASNFMRVVLADDSSIMQGVLKTYRAQLVEQGESEMMVDYKVAKYSENLRWQIQQEFEVEPEGTNLADIVQKKCAQLAIRASGGIVVESDGMSQYVERPGFDKAVVALAKSSGVLTGLHADHPTSNFTGSEAAMTQVLTKVYDHDVLSGDRVVKTRAHPERLDSSVLWPLANRSPEQAIEWLMSGWLSFEQNTGNGKTYKETLIPDF